MARKAGIGLLSALFIFSAVAKLFTLGGSTEEIYKWLLFTPIGFVDQTYIKAFLITLSGIEISLSVLILFSYKLKSYPLYLVGAFLLIMIPVNVLQWTTGFENCGCFGLILEISPEFTLAKTTTLFLLTLYLIRANNQKNNSL